MKKYTVTVEIRGRENRPMSYTTNDKKDAERFAAYYRKNKYKYPHVKIETYNMPVSYIELSIQSGINL